MSVTSDLPSPAARTVAPGTYGARIHTTLATVGRLWTRLESEGTATAYQRLDWVTPIVERLSAASKAEPLIVEVVDGSGRPVMIVPLARIRHSGYRVITWLDLGVCDYAAPILAPGIDLNAEDMALAWAAIRDVLPRADLIQISRIPDDVLGRPNPIATLAACHRMDMQASGVAIDGDAETLLSRLCRPSTLKDMAKLRRRLERAGTVTFVEARNANEIDTIFDALVEQRRSRFAEIGRFNLLSRPDVEAFYREAAHHGLNGGPVRLFGLSVDGEWIAAAYGLVHSGTFHGILLTMAGDAWRNTSPGLHIVAEALRWARAEGLGYFDFTVGVMPYKSDFGVQTRDLSEIAEVATLRGHLVKHTLKGASAARIWLRGHPEWYSRAQNARRWLRRKVA
ncbi:GNAT family N-acetyltransferase [Methylobacterium sp. 77]|uniref:GNAT family N-acetyltransferase n=1 Tax=Methylobacterium sp. 77 TaxID=1101192 RepID=UPI00037D0D44|nr:GNAT family N-acetyltransferase [Methylobacterium sp. 77]